MSTPTAKQEWSAHWHLPFLGMLGIAGSATLGYSSGVFMQPITEEFGWSRAQFSSAFTAQMLLALIVGPLVGRMIDRHGPRRVALVGVFAFIPGLSALGLATGVPWQWWALGALQAVCTAMIAPPTWISAIVPRFLASRGMALAVALAGVGVGTAIWPVAAAYFVEHIGWRASFAAMALCWGLLMVPLTFLFFTDPPCVAPVVPSAKPSSLEYRQALLSRDFICITLAGGLYASMSYAMILHSVPMLRANGLTLTQAATLAGVTGLCSITGRLCTGFLLDRFRTRPIAIVVFLLPILVSLLLRSGGGSWESALLAVMLLGLSAGAETDVV
ncbi:MAG TPA: MFS transporter, partial [Sphingobium sp.]